MRDLRILTDFLLPIVARAGEAIMSVYDGGFTVHNKEDDSPLTAADLESQRIIVEGLTRMTPDVPILSEESIAAPWTQRHSWTELWMVDPLDGTREFIKRNGEFTVNVALIVAHEPVLGVVSAPARGLVYWGARGIGAFTEHARLPRTAISTVPAQRPVRVVGSRSHLSERTAEYLKTLDEYVMNPVGSSLKFCLLAEGKADLYPRFGPTSEWDTAAGQAVLEAAGGKVERPGGHRLRYNCRESLVNGDFIAFADPRVLPTAGSLAD